MSRPCVLLILTDQQRSRAWWPEGVTLPAFDRLSREGKARAGQPLTDKGKIISGKKGQKVVDGPFAESKEAIGGYFLLLLDDFNEALEIAKECPALDYGLTVEVRPVADQCRTMQRMNELLADAIA